MTRRKFQAWLDEARAHQSATRHCCCKRSWLRVGRKSVRVRHGPDWARKKIPRNLLQPCGALGTRQETQQHVMQSQSSSRGQSTEAIAEATRPPWEPHAAQSTETTLPSCKRSTIQCPAEPSRRNWNAAPPARAPKAPGHLPRVALVIEVLSQPPWALVHESPFFFWLRLELLTVVSFLHETVKACCVPQCRVNIFVFAEPCWSSPTPSLPHPTLLHFLPARPPFHFFL